MDGWMDICGVENVRVLSFFYLYHHHHHEFRSTRRGYLGDEIDMVIGCARGG